MRVITAIYLHCKPELRDEWLCGGDVDGVVEEALPLEQASRNLVHWYHLREYREAMEGKEVRADVEREAQEGESDFFTRELEKIGWGMGMANPAVVDADPDNEEADFGCVGEGGPDEFEGGPLALEGWA